MQIVYIMNVDWYWIKQRPHFIAERLSKYDEVTVFYQHRYSRKGYQSRNENENNLNIKPIYVIPRGDRYKCLGKINQLIKRATITKYIQKVNAEYVYITFPDQVEIISHYSGKIIYDCMDNHAAFVKNVEKKQKLIEQERKLVNKATYILCSSKKLESILIERYGDKIKPKIYLVRNGYDGKLQNITEKKKRKDRYTISYFGTISSWFNFEFLMRSLEDFVDIEYQLIGPNAGVEIPKNSRIKYVGSVEHDKLYETIENSDCLMMPFKVNDIIESVDPVKLYEYINFYKNILCVRYKEVERFDKFVFFYDTYEEYKQQLNNLIRSDCVKYTIEERNRFLKDNDWTSRALQIESIMNNNGGIVDEN